MHILFELFITFFRIGAFTVGGGYAMLPLIQREVESKGWIAGELVVNFVAIAESTPGPFAINMATYVGTEMYGWIGAFVATLGVVLPSFIIILIVAKCYEKFQASRTVKGIMSGLKPAVVGLIGMAVISIGKTVFFPAGLTLGVLSTASFYAAVVIFAIMAYLSFKKNLHPIKLICIAAVAGIIAGYALKLPV